MDRKLPCGIAFTRGMLLLLNIIFVFIGLTLIGLGIYIKVDNDFAAILNDLTKVSDFKMQTLGFLAFVAIGGGVLTVLIALLGCMGSLWHSRCLLYTYAGVLIALMVLELVGFIMAFAYKKNLQEVYNESLTRVFTDALDNNVTSVLNVFHDLEKSLKCCGSSGIKDYTSHSYNPPQICYEYPIKGCANAIIDLLDKNLPLIGSTLGIVLLLELVNLIFALILATSLKNSGEETFSSNPGVVLAAVVPGRRRNYRNF